MKSFLAILATVLFFVFAGIGAMSKAHGQVPVLDRAARVEHLRAVTQAALDERDVKDTAAVTDTGDSMNLGEGDSPLVIIKLPKLGRECLVALHPTDANLFATIGCDDVPPETGL